jgi:hypothetical protein
MMLPNTTWTADKDEIRLRLDENSTELQGTRTAAPDEILRFLRLTNADRAFLSTPAAHALFAEAYRWGSVVQVDFKGEKTLPKLCCMAAARAPVIPTGDPVQPV